MTITVTAVNDAPVAVNDAATTAEDTPVSGNVLGNDTDVDDARRSRRRSARPGNGTVTWRRTAASPTRRRPNFNGTDSFTYTVSDGTAVSNVATVTITVNAVNDAPVAVNDAATTTEETAVSGNVLTNDTDVDGHDADGDARRGPANGTVTLAADGSFTYTPAANFNGTDSFTYTASDGTAVSNVATVTITVTRRQRRAGGGQRRGDDDG